MPPPNSYDLVPYRTKPRRTSHPDPAAASAILAGLHPTPIDRCRVLEIGCGTGGNLTAMASTLPGSQFLGIDPSPVQIASAEDDVRRFALNNITYKAIGIEDLEDEAFDYIICHGVYSWIPPAIQKLLLAGCGHLLSPHGVAMISYNVLPGWRYRSVGRDAMRYAVRNIDDPMDKVKKARGYLSFLAGATLDPESSHGRNLREEDSILKSSYDYYIAHEHFEDHHSPCYFHEFVEQAAANGLQYLGEAGFHPFFAGLSEQTREILMRISANHLDLEQHVDFLRNRTFRHTLLVRSDAPLSREARTTAIEKLSLRSATIENPSTMSRAISESHEYRSFNDVEMTTASPLMNALLTTLNRQAPRSLPFPELRAIALQRIAEEAPDQSSEADRLLVKGVFDMEESGFVTLHTWQPDFSSTPSERPHAWPVAADAARTESLVPSRLHSMVRVDPLDRFLLCQCNGERTIPQIIERLKAAKIEGDTADILKDPDGMVRERIDRLHQYAVFIA